MLLQAGELDKEPQVVRRKDAQEKPKTSRACAKLRRNAMAALASSKQMHTRFKLCEIANMTAKNGRDSLHHPAQATNETLR
jgi:hypothetical protein